MYNYMNIFSYVGYFEYLSYHGSHGALHTRTRIKLIFNIFLRIYVYLHLIITYDIEFQFVNIG